jgi:CRP-like cAMP-binding protein
MPPYSTRGSLHFRLKPIRPGKLFWPLAQGADDCCLREGSVAIVKDAIEIAKVAESGAVFGELSALLDQPHTADVRALETSQFHVAEAADLLRQDPVALLYVAEVLARRLDGANRALIELKHQLQAGQPRSVINKTVEKVEEMLGVGGASLVYAGYPYDPYA